MSYGSIQSTQIPARSVPSTRPLRVLLLEASAERAALIERALDALRSDVIVQRVDAVEAFERGVAESTPDVLLVDRALPRDRGGDAFARLRAQCPAAPLIFVAGALDQAALSGVLRDLPDDVLTSDEAGLARLGHAIEAGIAARQTLAGLSPRQLQVLIMVGEGRSTREIAERLGLSVKTVESHRGAMMKRLGLHDVAGLVRYAVHMRLVRADGLYS